MNSRTSVGTLPTLVRRVGFPQVRVMLVSGHPSRAVEVTDFYLDPLWHVPNLTVFGWQEDQDEDEAKRGVEKFELVKFHAKRLTMILYRSNDFDNMAQAERYGKWQIWSRNTQARF